MAEFARDARNVALITLVSRIFGLLREAVTSRVFGAAAVTDALFFALLVPNLMRRLFGEGALAAAFLPEYARLDQEDPAAARALATLVVGRLVLGLGAVVLAAELVLAALLAAGPGPDAGLALRLTMIALPYAPLVCLVALLGAMLQTHGRFGPPAAAPIVLNLCFVAGALGWPLIGEGAAAPRAVAATTAVVVAGVIQVLWSLHALRGRSWRTRELDPGRAAARAVGRRMAPMMLGLGVLQLNTLLDGLIASWPTVIGPEILGRPYPLEAGAMASVSFAQRLYQFPLGVFGIAVATAIFPRLSRSALGDPEAFAETVRRGLRLVVFIGLPASAGLVLVRGPLVATILEGGGFDAADTTRVGRVLLGYAPAIWAYSATQVLARAFYARNDAMTPVRVAAGMVGLNLALNLVLIWTPLREAGLAVSTAICATIQALLLAALLRRRVGSILDETVLLSWARSAAATLVMAAPLLILLGTNPVGESWIGSAAMLLGATIGGAVLFAGAASRLRMPELRWAMGRS